MLWISFACCCNACLLAVVLHEGDSTAHHLFIVKSGTFTNRRSVRADPECDSEPDGEKLVPTVSVPATSRPNTAVTSASPIRPSTASASFIWTIPRPSTAASAYTGASPAFNRGRRLVSAGGETSRPRSSPTRAHSPQVLLTTDQAVEVQPVTRAAPSDGKPIIIDTGKLLKDAVFGDGPVASDSVVADSHGCEAYRVNKTAITLLMSIATSTPLTGNSAVSTVEADKALLRQATVERLQRLKTVPLQPTAGNVGPSPPPRRYSYRGPPGAVRPLSRAGRSPRATVVYNLPDITEVEHGSNVRSIESAAAALVDAGIVGFASEWEVPVVSHQSPRPATPQRKKVPRPGSAGPRFQPFRAKAVGPHTPIKHPNGTHAQAFAPPPFRRPVSAAGFNWKRRKSVKHEPTVLPAWARSVSDDPPEPTGISVFVTQHNQSSVHSYA